MTAVQAVLLLSMAIAVTVAWDPDCSRCNYENGIGFVAGEFCQVYYMCTKSPSFKHYYNNPNATHDKLYRWQIFCCARGLAWDQEHLACKRSWNCTQPRDKCPEPRTTTDTECPNQADPNDDTKYFTATWERMMCPYGQVWKQELCTCIFKGKYRAPCRKLLHYKFNNTFDSDSCYNFAVGEPYGNPYTTSNMLCLDGTYSFLSIPYLNNYFAWNPVAKTFTLCFFIKADYDQTAGVFSTNCYRDQVSLLDLWLDEGILIANLGGKEVDTGEEITKDLWSKVCVTFDNGHYVVSVNTVNCGEAEQNSRLPLNSHSAATVGYVEGKSPLKGYIDDVCFWTYVLSDEELKECYDDGPSSDGDVAPPSSDGSMAPP